jgi:hypothetical protein
VKPAGLPNIAVEALYAASNYDPESSRVGREGFDRDTVNHFVFLTSHPEVAGWFRSLAHQGVTEDHILAVIQQLSRGPDVFDAYQPPDLTGYVGWGWCFQSQTCWSPRVCWLARRCCAH